ncbi:hypothetical protein, partial [Klebsiella michiganensis]|uniref:hypothetical protein n=1 Tax=Klebsiella michiganensis TaxID=1134687 RepID=UPI001CCDCAAF
MLARKVHLHYGPDFVQVFSPRPCSTAPPVSIPAFLSRFFVANFAPDCDLRKNRPIFTPLQNTI